MAESQTIAIPDQPPAGGQLSIMPLGGDGFTAPHSIYMLDQAQADGTASTGTNLQIIEFDPQYEALVTSVTIEVTSTADAPEFTLELRMPPSTPGSVWAQGTMHKETDLFGFARATWVPSPMFRVAQLRATVENVLTENMLLSAIIYNFRKRASELVPLNYLLSSLPRAASLI